MRQRIGRHVLVAVAVVAAVLVLAAVGLPLLVSGDGLRRQAEQRIAAATGAEVDLGETRLRVFPRLTLQVGPSTIAGTGAGLRAAGGDDHGIVSYAARVEGVELGVGLLALLQRRVEVGEFRLDGDDLEVVRDGQEIRVTEYALVVEALEAGLPASVPADAPPGEKIPADLSCRASLRAAALTVDGEAYEDVAADGELSGRLLRIEDIAARRAGGRITGAATLDYAQDPWGVLTFAYSAEDVPAEALLEPFVPDLAARLEGALAAAGEGSCSLRDGDAALATLAITGDAAAGEGVLHAADWLGGVSSYLGQRQDLKDVRFRGLAHAYRIEDGRYLVQDLEIDGHDTAWRGAGWVGLDGTLDLALQVKLPPGFTPDLGQWSFVADMLRDEQGRVQLDLTLTGRTARPAVSLDLTRLKEAAAEQNGESLRKGVRGLLDKWRTK